MAMGHEYCGVVEEVGSAVTSVRPGQFVVGSFCISDNTCPHCRFGFQSSCEQREFMSGAQAPLARVPLADGTLVATPEPPAVDETSVEAARTDAAEATLNAALPGSMSLLNTFPFSCRSCTMPYVYGFATGASPMTLMLTSALASVLVAVSRIS